VRTFDAAPLADWCIVSSNATSGAVAPVTNHVITKVGAMGLRRDTDATSSVLVLSDRPEPVQLFHENKTYVRVSTAATEPGTHSGPHLTPVGQEQVGRYPSRVLAWTNGTDRGRIWVAPVAQVLEPIIVGLYASTGGTNTGVFQSPGALFEKNSIVVATELTRAVPV